jgi:hypothetical protein
LPLDYSDPRIPSTSSNNSYSRAAAPEITDRGADRDRIRRINADLEKRKQEEADARLAKQIADDEAHQAMIELERYRSRAKERAENLLAETEKRRAEEREKAREESKKAREERELKEYYEKREKELKEEKERKAKELREAKERKERKDKTIKKERNRLDEEISRRKKQVQDGEAKRRSTDPRNDRDVQPPIRKPSTSGRSRRVSISQEISQREKELLLAETEAQMEREREVTKQREDAERAAYLWKQQQQQTYYDPRRDDRMIVPNENPGLGRRGSVSSRRNSFSSGLPALGPRRVSIHQAAPPAALPGLNTSVDTTNYSMRGPSMLSPGATTLLTQPLPRQHQPPPTTHHAVFSQPYANTYPAPPQQPSTRRPSPSPFASTESVPRRQRRPSISEDHLPAVRQHRRQSVSEDHLPALRRQGEKVISQSEARERAREATRGLKKVVDFQSEVEYRSDSQDDTDYEPRIGRRGGNKRKG